MLLTERFKLNEKQKKSLARRGYLSCEHYLRMLPKKYHDYREVSKLEPNNSGKDIAVLAYFDSCTYDRGKHLATAKLTECGSGIRITVNWIGNFQVFKDTFGWSAGTPVLIGGVMEYSYTYQAYSFFNPYVFSNNIAEAKCFYQEYGTMKDFDTDTILSMHHDCLDNECRELLPGFVMEENGLMGVKEMYHTFQYPDSTSSLNKAVYRMEIEQLLYYAIEMEKNCRQLPKGSPYHLKTMKETMNMVHGLPFKLTNGQQDACNLFYKLMKDGRRINALVQGDVGSGKTMVAFIAMFMAADSGYQSVLMAPTYVLAMQHYKKLSEMGEEHGFKTAFIGGKQKVSEKRKILEGIKNGEYQFIVGTHGVFSDSVVYKNLAVVITDEEHRFGVVQRENVVQKAGNGVHTITMSATPIPRTIASVLYGDTLEVCTIKDRPAGRKPIKTQVYESQQGILKFMEMQIKEGRQAYVICPLIEKAQQGSKMEKVDSVEHVYEIYKDYFEGVKDENGNPVEVSILTGKTPVNEAEEILDRFSKNEIKVLVATTVVEVGVDVPNASLIVIHNAERFGMAALHQLRGRVGRGDAQSYCILKSGCMKQETYDKDASARLNALVQTQDGYEVALADLRNRGTGDLVGTDQSGNNPFIDLLLKHRTLYVKLRKSASVLCDNGTESDYLEEFKKQYDYFPSEDE